MKIKKVKSYSHWTAKEKLKLKKLWYNTSIQDILLSFPHRTKSSINKKAWDLKFTRIFKPKRRYCEQYQNWIDDYLNGLSCHQIGKKYNVNYQYIHSYLKNKTKIKIRSYSETSRRYQIDESAFDSLNEKSIYWLGCLYGDGCLHENINKKIYHVSLTGDLKDIEHGEKLKKFLNTDKPLSFRKDKKCYTFSIASLRISSKLLEYGLTPRKTHTMRYPNFIPYKYQRDFIRGLFDTDGCISYQLQSNYKTRQFKFSICLNKFFLQTCADIICDQLKIKPRKLYISKRNSNTAVFAIGGRQQMLKLRKWLYEGVDDSIFLKRKRDLFYSIS